MVAMFIAHVTIIVCYMYNLSIGIVMMICTFIAFFKFSMGPIPYMHAQETCLDEQNGFINMTLWVAAIASCYAGVGVMQQVDTVTMFIMFACIIFFGTIYIVLVTKDTTFKLEEIYRPVTESK